MGIGRLDAVGLAVTALTALTALTSCVPGDETSDTLSTLVPPLTLAAAPTTASPSTTGAVAPTTSTTAPSTTAADLPVADWTPGIRYDIGVVEGVTSVQGNAAIEYDRFSYDHPTRGVIDAEGLNDEPIEYWYSASPFFNIRQEPRTFVLAPDVEIVVLGQRGRARACSSSGNAPSPVWQPRDVSSLRDLAGTDRLASLTYSSQGLVERIRFTEGC